MACASPSAPGGRRASTSAAGCCRTASAAGIEAGGFLRSVCVMTTETAAVDSRPRSQIHAGRERECGTKAMASSLQFAVAGGCAVRRGMRSSFGRTPCAFQLNVTPVPTEKSVRASPADSHREHPRTVGRSRRRCCKPCCHRSVLRPTLVCPPCCPPSRPRSAPCSANAPTSFWRTSPCASISRSSPGGGPGRGSPPSTAPSGPASRSSGPAGATRSPSCGPPPSSAGNASASVSSGAGGRARPDAPRPRPTRGCSSVASPPRTPAGARRESTASCSSEARLDPAFEQEDLVLGKIYEERSAEAPLQRRVQPHAAEAQQEGLAIRGG